MTNANRFAFAMLISATLSTGAHAATTAADLQALQNFDPLAEIQQVQRNRAAAARTEYSCTGNITQEQTGKIFRNQTIKAVAGDLIGSDSTSRTYHEEDNSGSSTLIVNTTNNTASYNVMTGGEVVVTGYLKCKGYK